MTDQWLSAEQAGHLLNIKSPETIYRAYRDGAFGNMAIMVGTQLRVNPAFFRSAQEAARNAALIEMAEDLVRRANALKEIAEEPANLLEKKPRRGFSGVDDRPPKRTPTRIAGD